MSTFKLHRKWNYRWISSLIDFMFLFNLQVRGKKFRVKYNYIPANLDELELHVNDIVEVISEIEEGWWEGRLGKTVITKLS